MKKNISIIIPILNEEKNISKLISKINSNLSGILFEIIFVDDNSTDNSHKVLDRLKNNYKFVKYIIRKNKKRDLTQSCFEGFKIASYNNVLIMDGDLQHDPKYIMNMLDLLIQKKLDLVVGARNFNKKIIGLSLFRKVTSIILKNIINFCLEKKTEDPMSGFFILKKNIYIKNKNRYFGKGYKILCDFLYSSAPKLKVKDYFIKFNNRNKGKSKMNFGILIKIILFIIFRLKKNFLLRN
jgi:dolichol-phosphate mannosyltransferase